LRTKYRRKVKLSGFIWIDGELNVNLESKNKPSLLIGKGCKFLGRNDLRTRDSANLVIGDNVKLDGPVRFVAAGQNHFIEVGDGCRFTPYSIVNGGGNISFGESSVFGPRLNINANKHIFGTDIRITDSGFEHVDISISENVWIGSDVNILPGSQIKANSVVGANSVVNCAIGPNEIFAGSPARKIGNVLQRTDSKKES
jgi:acetyltransferase-like isoleucine patch superfamily enzyme